MIIYMFIEIVCMYSYVMKDMKECFFSMLHFSINYFSNAHVQIYTNVNHFWIGIRKYLFKFYLSTQLIPQKYASFVSNCLSVLKFWSWFQHTTLWLKSAHIVSYNLIYIYSFQFLCLWYHYISILYCTVQSIQMTNNLSAKWVSLFIIRYLIVQKLKIV